ncbi:PREDICTED: uncharacterized protein LOC105362025 [Ceratosolen solmsi marchali]|uniref:Uncharacterized protein LOC105362025 n=1 Tax=Ceratosolen solmsi marchali TaxID=326594 RepID=A0AAJ6YGI8_9HYME|nr:PREDICTED: uncharacterized protein LOC105362025 [Ceratosolen solmsi marchali]
MNFMVHHYQEYGTKYSISAINDKMIVCLGRNGNLVGLQICELEENIVAEKMEELQWECKENGKFSLCNDQTWLEQKKADDIQAEENKSTALKKDILTDIKILKSKVPHCILLSFNGNTIVNNFSLRHLNESEKIDDHFIEVFDTPLSNIYAEHTDNKEIVSRLKLLTAVTAFGSRSYTLDDKCFLEHSDAIMLSGSSSFKWLNDNTPISQLMNLNCNPRNYDIATSKEYKLKLKHQVLKETSERLMKLDELNGRLKNLFGTVEKDANKFNNIKWHSMEVLEEIMNDDKDASPDMINNCLSNQNKGVIYDYAFREEKLDEMMDGVLEKRWEDEIAKDIQKPYCLTFKSPSKYNDEDIKAVEAYQQMVENLEIEREKYKVHLVSEINNINAKIRGDIDDFDKRMHALAIERIKIQSAVLQEFLLRLNEERYRASTEHEENKMSLLINKDLVQLEDNCQIIIAEIANVKPIILELKKMCLCLITDRNSQILPKEYLDFLCNMDAMDAMPTNLPFQIDSTLWQTFCTLRRNKVESEIKIKMAALELANAEQTHSYLQRLNLSIQNNICTIKSTIAEQKQKQLKMTDNFNVQIVLKSEQIEVDLSECFSNFNNATLVTYKHLTEINGNIVKEGKKNINVIRARMSLRKSILLLEWKYQCSLTKVKHLKEHLALVQNTKVNQWRLEG